MKYLLTIIVFLFSVALFANDEKYVAQMTKSIDAVYKAQTTEEFQSAINTFDRIGNAEKTKWEPFYYSAWGYIMLSTREMDGGKKDAYLDKATEALNKATAILPNDSEIVSLEGFVQMMRITVDPPTRGPQYSMMAVQTFGKAVGLNPNNPRALSLMAQMQLGTAQFFKQEPTEACQTARKADGLFANDASNENKLAPTWGKWMNDELIKNCK